jgi:dihydrofolate reductase / thymidylate synthase
MNRYYKNTFNIIAAISNNNCIGKNGLLPWNNISEDMNRFKEITTNTKNKNKINAVIMGENTWNSLPKKFKPLKNRKNIILSRKIFHRYNTKMINNINDALDYCIKNHHIENTFIIGGGEIYKQVINDSRLDKMYITKINKNIDGDIFFPEISLNDFNLIERTKQKETNDGKINYTFNTYIKRNKDEEQYLNLLQNIINNGIERNDRTNIGTYSIFGEKLEFDLRYTFPLLTTKKMYWKAIVEELLWFIKGSTNSKELEKKGINIWKGNSSREFLDNRGLTYYSEGDIGPLYSFQWRHFGAEYKGCNENYIGQGVDQLQNIINEIKLNPHSRRLYMSAWNPKDESKMSILPCHISAQFFIDNNYGLYCQMYQRSVDAFLGFPFNIASYALLTNMIAQINNLKPQKLIMCLGDVHIYKNHIEQCKLQLERIPNRFPRIKLNPFITNINDFTFNDINLKDYYYYSPIKANMAI